MRQRLAVGNWKMHGSLPENQALLDKVAAAAGSLSRAHAVVCVPYPYLAQAQSALAGSKAAWGSQNVSQYPKGAFTGEVSAGMLREFGCRYAIVGHSERRQLFGEDDDTVASKAKAVLVEGMVPIVCVGETLAERERGVTEEVVGRQLGVVAERIGTEGLMASILAYEPVWAIGTGKVATTEQARDAHRVIRATLDRVAGAGAGQAVAILYGGSVNAGNAAALFAENDVDGALVGGASLEAASFWKIVGAAASAS
jgi:triosephosphate isomerase (TIM)